MSPVAAGSPPGICFVTDRSATGGRPLLEIIRAALAGGADRIQVREKDLQGRALLELARAVVEAAKTAGGRARVVVNDRLDVALAARAAGVHLPAEGLPIEPVRRRAAGRFLIGRSAHSLAEAQRARKDGADYVILGPIFPTPSKAGLGEPLGTETLRKAAVTLPIPVWAIGGIGPANAAALRGIPIAGVAAISAIAGAPDPAAAVRALREALAPGPPAA
ncbi:MAG: thiamine phosphate synthase [Acidobacteria bacterium]|nr:MAG: thiamine phosphate synthase [Acidobacteriota bacterium]